MTDVPGTPKVAQAALVVFQRPIPIPTIINIQYNPDKITRELKANAAEGAAQSDAFRLAGAPTETIKMDCIFDATDGLERDDWVTKEVGVYADLASLEMLLAPTSVDVIRNEILMSAGTIEILPAEAPFTVLVWGRRVLPVRISGFTVAEEAFDARLNPIRASVSLSMTVLTYSDLERSHPGYAMYLGHQIVKETLSFFSRANGTGSILSQKISAN